MSGASRATSAAALEQWAEQVDSDELVVVDSADLQRSVCLPSGGRRWKKRLLLRSWLRVLRSGRGRRSAQCWVFPSWPRNADTAGVREPLDSICSVRSDDGVVNVATGAQLRAFNISGLDQRSQRRDWDDEAPSQSDDGQLAGAGAFVGAEAADAEDGCCFCDSVGISDDRGCGRPEAVGVGRSGVGLHTATH